MEVKVVKRGAENQGGSPPSGRDASNVVVWLIPLDNSVQAGAGRPAMNKLPRLVQRNKSFEPHVLVVEVGTTVQFPNKDPFFHNIFSLFEGKRFDLGLYEAGSSRSVRFDRAGISFLFCNIHGEMSAVIVAVETPYFGVSNRLGHLGIPDTPDGRYQMHAWYERSSQEDLDGLTRMVTISASSRSVDRLLVIENPNFTNAHKNKYGQDYVEPPHPSYKSP
jgi:plastocyanin